MEQRQLGATSVYFSPVVFGAWAIGGWMWGGTNEKEAAAAIRASLDSGVTTIDTAPVYGFGLSESIVGKAIRGRRDEVIIATKCGLRWDTDEGSMPWKQVNIHGKEVTIRRNSRKKSIIHECEQSLKRLQVDVIDLYQIHWPDTTTSLEEAWGAMVQLQHEGKVRAIGVSNFSLEQLRHVHNIRRVDSIQSPYSLIRRQIEEDIVPFCQKNQIGILAYSPLERGLLTGTVSPSRTFLEGDHRATSALYTIENRTRVLKALEEVRPIAKKYKAAVSQVIISCTIHMPGMVAALVGARNPDQARENAKSGDLNLLEEEKRRVVNALGALSDMTRT